VRLFRDRRLAEELVAGGRETVEPFRPARIAQTVAWHYREMLGIAGSARPYNEAYASAMAATS